MSGKAPTFMLAGGGTGGHLFPAIAIADELRKERPDAQILFIGTKDKIEGRVVPQRGYTFKTIWIGGFHRTIRPGNLVFPLKVMVSLFQSFSVIREYRPDVVIGTGGYVSGPVLYVASRLGIPTVIHESNSYPGITTRLLAGRATRVFLAFERAQNWLKRTDNVEFVGTPTRESLGTAPRSDAARSFDLDPTKQTVLVLGGSLGAASINSAMLGLVDELQRARVQLIWQTGYDAFEQYRRALTDRNPGWVGPFIENMDHAYSAADLVVCRSGAMTIAELTRVGKPAILVPYPLAAEDHQTFNARELVQAGAAIMIPDATLGSGLKDALFMLLRDGEQRLRMAAASRQLAKPNAASEIAKTILTLTR